MSSKVDLAKVLVSPDRAIRDLLRMINASGLGIALVTDENGRLLATVTDGDIRRAILASIDFDGPVRNLMGRSDRSTPLTAPVGTSPSQMIQLMREAGVRHLPLIDHEGRVVDLVRLGDVDPEPEPPITAVIMAGGLGTRLQPLTNAFPKPLLPVGDTPVLEMIVKQLHGLGIRKVHVTTYFEAEKILRYFGNGEDFGIEITYVPEERPLGTAGALGLLAPCGQPLLVINGDVLTRLNFLDMVRFHQEAAAAITVGVREFKVQLPYGVVEVNGVEIQRISEKPTMRFFINAGVYLLEPEVQGLVVRDEPCDMPDLINRALECGKKVVSFPIHEYWIDIGQLGDYQKACDDVRGGNF